MNEPKPFASLSSGLLARKGSAKPAMRPQSYRYTNEGNGLAIASPPLDDLGWNDMGDDATPEAGSSTPVALHGAPVARLVIPPRVVVQQEELAQRLETVSEDETVPQDNAESSSTPHLPASETGETEAFMPVGAVALSAPLPQSLDDSKGDMVASRASAGNKPKAAFTLRLDPDRHLRLRLVCAVTHRSAQQVVTQALDEFLARQPENSRLASLG